MLTLGNSLPELSKELTELLLLANEPGLAAQCDDLRIVKPCSCKDDFCSSFYTLPKHSGSYGASHRNVSLEPSIGLIVLDIVEETIVYVEVLYRDEIKSQLNRLFP